MTDTMNTETRTEYLTRRIAELRAQAIESTARGEVNLAAIHSACAVSFEAALAALEADARGDRALAAAHRVAATEAACRASLLAVSL